MLLYTIATVAEDGAIDHCATRIYTNRNEAEQMVNKLKEATEDVTFEILTWNIEVDA